MASIVIDKEKCKGCELCIKPCPTKVIEITDITNRAGYLVAQPVHADKCIGCKLCAIMCPDSCITVEK